MTIIKQTGVQSSGHMKNLRGYINDDRKVILRDSLNMDGCTNPKRWAHHMWMTREAYGHNKAARRVRDKKTGELKEAKNTILFHQILGFNPDECDLNGGRLSPEECMRYAKEYVGKHYPNQQIVMALHNEYCKADKTRSAEEVGIGMDKLIRLVIGMLPAWTKILLAEALGALLAHFENKVMFQGFVWNVNSFDQEGVQLGKVLAKRVLAHETDGALKVFSDLLNI